MRRKEARMENLFLCDLVVDRDVHASLNTSFGVSIKRLLSIVRNSSQNSLLRRAWATITEFEKTQRGGQMPTSNKWLFVYTALVHLGSIDRMSDSA